jgi:poly(3-hydroxybutyrate) depolymerase
MKLAIVLTSLALAVTPGLSATLTPTTTTLTSSLNPSTFGQAVTFQAVVTSSAGSPPNGETVTFKQGSKVLGTSPLSGGSATFTISTLTTGGSDSIKAVYAGDSNFATSTSNVIAQVVNKAPTTTTLVSSENPSNVGQTVTFTATVMGEYGGTVTGMVAFTSGSTNLGSVEISDGLASLTTTRLIAGSDTVTATYKGASSFLGSNTGLIQTVGSGTYTQATMTWDGATRYYQVFAPLALPKNPPLVIMLHGTRTTTTFDPQSITSLEWNWETIANQYEFIVVQPASTYDQNTGQWNWNAYFMDAAFPYAQGCGAKDCPDDSGFLRQLIVNLTSQYNVNPNAVFATGMSSGAQMAERVGVEISDLVAAIAPASGQMVGQQNPPPGLPGDALAPVAVQEWHGTLDKNLWPCNYGTTKYSGVTFTLDTVDDTFDYWTTQNACQTLQTTQPLCLNDAPNNANDAPTPGMPNYTGNIATNCSASNVEVQFIWEPNTGHSWVPSNNMARWFFFSNHEKP